MTLSARARASRATLPAAVAALAALVALTGCSGSKKDTATLPSGTSSPPATSTGASPVGSPSGGAPGQAPARSRFAGKTLMIKLHTFDPKSGMLSFRLATEAGQYQYGETGSMHRLPLPHSARLRSWGWCGADRPSRPDGTGLMDCDLTEIVADGEEGLFDGTVATMVVGGDDSIRSLTELWQEQPAPSSFRRPAS